MKNACKVVNLDMLAEYTARNNVALQTLAEKHGVVARRLPDEVLQKLRTLSDEVVAEIAGEDAFSGKVYESYQAFRQQVIAWHHVSEQAYLNARGAG